MIPISALERTANELMAKAAIEIPGRLPGRACGAAPIPRRAISPPSSSRPCWRTTKPPRRTAAPCAATPACRAGTSRSATRRGSRADRSALEAALRRATAAATHEVPLRPNRVHPLWRTDHNNNVGINAPEIEYAFHPDADWIDLTTVHKGGLFGSDYRMLFPGDGIDGIKRFYLDTLIAFGKRGLACQPAIVGVGLGGSKDICHGARQAGLVPAHGRLAQSRSEDRRARGGAQGARQLDRHGRHGFHGLLDGGRLPHRGRLLPHRRHADVGAHVLPVLAARHRARACRRPRRVPHRPRCGSPTTCGARPWSGSARSPRRRSERDGGSQDRPSEPSGEHARTCARSRSARSPISPGACSPRARASTSARSRTAPACRRRARRSASPISIARRPRRSMPTAAIPSAR